MIPHHRQQTKQWIVRLTGTVLCVGTLAFWPFKFGEGKALQGAPMLWQQAKLSGEVPRWAETVKMIPVTVDVVLLTSAENARFALLLPDGASLTVIKVRQERIGEHGFIWDGEVEKDPLSNATFSVVKKTVVGNVITSKGKSYRLRYGKGSVHVVEEVDPAKFPPEAKARPVTGRRDTRLVANTCTTDTGDWIDVMVVYTQKAQDGAAGANPPQTIEAIKNQAEFETNASYSKSGISQRIRVIHVEKVDYVETQDIYGDLENLIGMIDGEMDNVRALRDYYHADAVVLLIEDGGGPTGYSYVMESVGNTFEGRAFAVVVRRWATGYYSFGHELGHIMGARHNWLSNTENNYNPDTYNHGYIQPTPTSPDVAPWRTIMAEDHASCKHDTWTTGCIRQRFWSNSGPNYTWEGDATGSQQADNARRLNNTAQTVANFRCHVTTLDTTPPSPPSNLNVQ